MSPARAPGRFPLPYSRPARTMALNWLLESSESLLRARRHHHRHHRVYGCDNGRLPSPPS
eukprot:9521012-Alexandrium_andersonii.AAC.1